MRPGRASRFARVSVHSQRDEALREAFHLPDLVDAVLPDAVRLREVDMRGDRLLAVKGDQLESWDRGEKQVELHRLSDRGQDGGKRQGPLNEVVPVVASVNAAVMPVAGELVEMPGGARGGPCERDSRRPRARAAARSRTRARREAARQAPAAAA